MTKDLEWLKRELEKIKFDGGRGGEDLFYYDDVMELFEQFERAEQPEMPEIPAYVANHIEYCKREKLSLANAMDLSYGNSVETGRYLFGSSELENAEKQKKFALAYLIDYTVKQEPRYIVKDKHGNSLLGKVIGGVGVGVRLGEVVHAGSGSEQLTTLLTEKEIKEFDEDYWIFAKPLKDT